MAVHQGEYRAAVSYKAQPSLLRFITIPKVLRWTPSLALWGGSALVAVLFFADSIPKYRRGILEKLPAIGWYYDDSIDPEDTPF